MPHIRMIAVTATAVMLAFALSPASARSCKDGEAACPAVSESAPMQLDNFMKTWKPVGVSKHRGKSKSARRRAVQEEAVAAAKSKGVAAKSEMAEAKSEPAVAETLPLAAESTAMFAANPEKTSQTDGVAVTSFSQANELDAAADQVQVVAFNEINEIDLAAAPPPVPVETVGQSVAPEPTGADNSWIGKLLLAAAGSIAIAGAARLLVA